MKQDNDIKQAPSPKAQRVREARMSLRLSQDRLGQSMGLSRYAITNIENGRAEVTDYFSRFFCLLHSVNPAWLDSGEGNMLNKASHNSREALRLFEALSPPLQEYALKQIQLILEYQRKQGIG